MKIRDSKNEFTISGSIIFSEHICPGKLYDELLSVINKYSEKIKENTMQVRYNDNEIPEQEFCYYLGCHERSECSEINTTDEPNDSIYVWSTKPPLNKNKFWIDTTPKIGGLKAYNADTGQWEHVPAFAVNADEL